jgi:hypothetical protein
MNLVPVVHSGALKIAIVDRKPKRFNQMQPAARREAKTGDISSIRRNFRFDQCNVKHARKKKRLNERGAFFIGREFWSGS